MALRLDKGKGKAVVYSGPTDSKGGAIFMGDQNAGRDINITTFTTIRPAARETYLKCLSSSELFQPLASELASLMTVLQLAEENAFQTKNSRVWDFRTKITTFSPMSFGYDTEMRTIMNGCHAVLSDIKKLLQEYDDLPSQAQSTWTRIEWDGARILDLRARLTSNVTMLSALNTSIMMSSQASVKQMLQKFIHEVRSGQRIGSVLSRQMGKPHAFNNQEAWHQIQKELQDVGITSEIFVEHQHLIVSSIKRAVSGGGLEDLPEELLLLEPVDDEVVFPKIESRNSYLGLRRPNEMSKDSELIQKAERGDIVRLTQLLQEGKDVDHKGENGETALMRIVMMISHTPKIFDINHALTLLRSSMDVEKPAGAHSTLSSDSADSEGKEQSSKGGTTESGNLQQNVLHLLEWTLRGRSDGIMSSIIESAILNRGSFTDEKPASHCCSCQDPFSKGEKRYQCETCSGFLDTKCQATLWKMFHVEKHELSLCVCQTCLIHVGSVCGNALDHSQSNRGSSYVPDVKKANRLEHFVDRIDFPQKLKASSLGFWLGGSIPNGAAPKTTLATTPAINTTGSAVTSINNHQAEKTSGSKLSVLLEMVSDGTGEEISGGPSDPGIHSRPESPNLPDPKRMDKSPHENKNIANLPAIDSSQLLKANMTHELRWEARSSSAGDKRPKFMPVQAKPEVGKDIHGISPSSMSTSAATVKLSAATISASLETVHENSTEAISEDFDFDPFSKVPTPLSWTTMITSLLSRKAQPSLMKAPQTTPVRSLQALNVPPKTKEPINPTKIMEIKRKLLTALKLLLEADADTELQSPLGYTPLALAALNPRPLESLIICKLLILHGANINAIGLNGTTILMRAAAHNHEHIVALLLHHGVDVTAKDDNGHAAWHWASRFGRSERILKMLREKGGCVEQGEVAKLQNKGPPKEENPASHMLPLLKNFVYSLEVPEKKRPPVHPDTGFWEEWLDMDKFS